MRSSPKISKMQQRLAVMLALSLTLCACSREDGPFAMSPLLSAHTDASAATVATCIESRWADATRSVRIAVAKHSIQLSAKTFFAGVRIGARLTEESGHTTVEYFERRLADRRYLAMVRACLHPEMPGRP